MKGVRSVVHQARREEQYGNLPGAIDLYRKALKRQENEGESQDPDLYNRLGDLYLRVGEPRTGVDCFEEAVVRLEEQQMYSAAIALCKKILRNAPGHAEAYRRTGRLQARVGLHAEARGSYIEYANRKERDGDPDRALEALGEFVELSGDEEIRLALADRYALADRTAEAVGELRHVWRQRIERGEDAAEIRRRIKEIDPEADLHPRGAGAASPEEVGSGKEEPEDGTPVAVEAAEAEPDIGTLASDLQAVLGRLEGEEKLRQALPVIDQLLRLEPDQVNLLQRKLSYTLALGDEEAAVAAYLDLGTALENRLAGFSLRFLSTSSAGGVTTAAMGVEERPAGAPRR